VGVPLITPVDGLRFSPAGNAGETTYEVTAPPLLVGVLAVIAVPLVYVAGLLE
jgi:hypothetical protein